MGNRKNLPQHGKSNPSPQFKMLKHFTEKNLRGHFGDNFGEENLLVQLAGRPV
jgi:hypothetical protein